MKATCILFTALVVFIPAINARCAFHGQCDTYQGLLGEVGIPCKVDMDPVPLNDTTAIEQLQKYCKDLWDSAPVDAESGNKMFCCDQDQVQNIVSNLEIPGTLMSRCPTCFRNFREYACQLPCSPVQRTFIEVTETDPKTNALKSINFNVSKDYAYKTWDSCRGVRNPQTQESIMQLLCGPYGTGCSYEDLFNYMGDMSNMQTPFEMKFRFLEGPLENKTFDYTAETCNNVAQGEAYSCSCIDCPQIGRA